MARDDFEVRLPHDAEGLTQDEEYCVVLRDGREQRVRFHDYDEIYRIPGLYEHLFYERLECASHDEVSARLAADLSEHDVPPDSLTVLELGAGNGLVGEAMRQRGIESIIGVDIIPEAADAALRDRPDVYEQYHVADMCDLPRATARAIEDAEPNCLVCVAALGFGDVPPEAFVEAYNLVADGGWIAFNIKQDFVEHPDASSFARLITAIIDEGSLEVTSAHAYRHRLALDGTPLPYVAVVGRKRADIGADRAKAPEGDVPPS